MFDSNVDVGRKIVELGFTLNDALLSNSTFIGKASGRSMEGVGIFDGDLLIIDRAPALKNGDVIVAVLNGLYICKIADLKNNQLLSANPDNPPLKLTDSDDYTVEGVVVSSIRMHRPNNFLLG